MTLLQVNNLNVSYQVNGRWIQAVRDFHVQVKAGEICGVVGESGSGKSTIATAIMGYLPANGRIEKSSQILFDGEELTTKNRAAMRALWGTKIKLVPQNPSAALNPSIKVGEQVAEIARQQMGMNRQQAHQATLDMFKKVQLADPENVANRYPHEMSGGMQQRVVIAMALITQPQLLILDEPTTGLDVTTEAVILDLIRALIDDMQATAVYITHNLGVVAQVCDKVVVMYAGEIMADGGVENLFARPIHPYTIGLMNSIPKVGQSKRQVSLQSIEGSPPSLKNLPKGCVFAPRCPLAIEICHAEKPPLEHTPDNRLVRCHRWREIVAGEISIEQDFQAGVKNIENLERESLLKVTHLTKHFPVSRRLRDILRGKKTQPVRAVDGVNLGIQQGRTLGLVGESGSGKTTLSRLMIGLEERTEGEIEFMKLQIRNNVRERSPDVLAKLQMVFQNPQNSLNPYLTIGQQIRRPLMKLAGLSRAAAEQEVCRLLRAVNLREEYALRFPNELSGGEKQRVAIARAFASDPALIICDEPVSALDVSVQAAVLNLLARLQEERDTAYLFISHDLAVVGYLADYIAVMYLGQLFEVGYGRDLFKPPFHPYTEALISAIPIPDPTHESQRIRLQGEIPSPRHLPTGCRFHTRCPHKIGAICEQQDPPWRDDGEGHFIKCHIPLEELTALQKNIGEGIG